MVPELEDLAGAASALLLGGIYDLAPLQSSFLANEIALTDLEVSSFSPLDHRHHRQTRVSLAYGERETAPFAVQAAAFEALLPFAGLRIASPIDLNGGSGDTGPSGEGCPANYQHAC